ncbi:sulfotransferase [uncultured Ruegeria sp.]|uniref:sulfotransferase n=1 Tax=uncultured Ruegeria sp. TaxID=259304 RepID=UPI00262D963E|nr:sulfotransferase [uncultured Ruegeria sp.]
MSLQKTGTKSVAGIFGNYRAAHEFQHEAATEALSAYKSGELNENEVRAYLATRDAIGQLEVDSTSFNTWFAEQYVDLFPGARFLIILRHPIEWLDSVLTHIQRDVFHTAQTDQPYPDRFKRQAELVVSSFSPEAFLDDEQLIKALPEISKGLLVHWQERNTHLINTVPVDRRLVLRTDRLSASIPQLAQFVGVPSKNLIAQQSHLHRKPDHPTTLDRYNVKIDTDDALETWQTWQNTVFFSQDTANSI